MVFFNSKTHLTHERERERERAIIGLRLWVWELGVRLWDSRVSSMAEIKK